jgi:tetratricopeptide (TPR) repeat protein
LSTHKDKQEAAGEQPAEPQGDRIDIGNIEQSDAVAIGRGARATINNYTEIIVKADSIEDLPPTPGEPPFKGLAYFTEEDADIFFGREELSDQIAARLLKTRFLAVIGASGSGKSSLLRAGIIPRMRRKNWLIKVMTPTSRPLERLATTLTTDDPSLTAADEMREAFVENPRALLLAANKLAARSNKGNILLVVDQFEELFTLCHDEDERKQFVESLLAAVADEGALTILIGLRADFYDRCADYEGLRDLVSRQQEFIGPMRQEDLVRVIAEPAKRGGWQFVDGLVEQILEDVGREPGRLPLLSHALLETWRLRRGTVMTLGGYRAAGGVEGAIAKTAENLLKSFDPTQLTIVEHIFLSLTELGQQAEDTRRIASKEELIHGENEESVDVVLEDLVRARLVTIDGEQVEVAHEALIRRWPRLGEWLDENRDRLQFERQLRQDVQRWEASQRDAGYLYRGSRLMETDAWLGQLEEPLSGSELEFIEASRALEAEEERRAAQLRSAQTRQRILIGVAVFLLVAVVAAAIFGQNLANLFREPGMMEGQFNIAVALMGEGVGVPEGAGSAVSTRIGAGLQEALKDFSGVQVWYDSSELRRSENVVIGEVDPGGDVQQALQEKAQTLNADALIYGSVLEDGSSNILQLHMYLDPQFGADVGSWGGFYQFTDPVTLFDPLDPGLEIQKPVQALAQMALGLSFSQLGQAEDALTHFQQAAELMPNSDMALYFVGQEHFHLSNNGGDEAAAQLDEAEAAFSRALKENENARARIGLGVVHLERAQALLDQAQTEDCTAPAVADMLQNALAETDAAQEEFHMVPQRPLEIDLAEYGGPVKGILHLDQAILHRTRANSQFCLGDSQTAIAELNSGLADLDVAEPDFQQVSYHRSLARLYQARGSLYHWLTFLMVQNQDDGSREALQKGIQAFGQCLQQGDLAPVDEFLQTVIIPLCEDGLAELQSAGGVQ